MDRSRTHTERTSEREHNDVDSIETTRTRTPSQKTELTRSSSNIFDLLCTGAKPISAAVCCFFCRRHCMRSSEVCLIICCFFFFVQLPSQVYACVFAAVRFLVRFSRLQYQSVVSVSVCACLFSKFFAFNSVSISYLSNHFSLPNIFLSILLPESNIK